MSAEPEKKVDRGTKRDLTFVAKKYDASTGREAVRKGPREKIWEEGHK